MSEHGPKWTDLFGAAPDFELSPPVKYAIDGGWLVEVVDYHTCGAGGDGYGHESGCGLIPIADISDLLAAERAKARREAAAEHDAADWGWSGHRSGSWWLIGSPRGRRGGCGRRAPCGCPADMHIGEIGCPCGLPDEPPRLPATPPAGDASTEASVRLTQPMGEQGWVSHRSRDGLQGARHTSTETCPWCPEASSSASEPLTEAIGMSLYESLMEASADQWKRWGFLTDKAKEKYRAEAARIIAEAVEPHLTARVADAEAKARAEAWDEGYESAICDTEARSAPPGPNGPVDPTPNPYGGDA